MTGWRTAKLEEVTQVLGGGTPSRKEESFFGGTIAWATPTDITSLDSLYIAQTKETITDEGLKNSSTKLMPAGSVLLTSRATIGFTAVASTPICTNQGFVNFICGPDLVPEFLAYWLRTQKQKMFQLAGGTTFKEIARGALRKFEIAFPSTEEQRHIVDILSRAAGIVRLRREAQKKTEEIIPALFLDMFGDPEMNQKKWQTLRLDEVCEISYGIADKLDTSITEEQGLRILTISNVLIYGAIDQTVRRFCKATKNQVKKSSLQRGDLLFNWRNGSETHIGKTAIWESDEPVLHVSFLLRLRPNIAHINSYFLWTMLNLLRSRKFFINVSRQQINRKFNASELSALKLPIPPIDAQKQFSTLIHQIRSIQSQQIFALQKAETTFDALLAQVFDSNTNTNDIKTIGG